MATAVQPPSTRTVQIPALDFRAAISASSINDDARTVELTFTTGAPVKRYDWGSGGFYLEKLSMDPAHVRLDRLNSGAPVLDTHDGYSLASMLGVVEDGSARMQGKKGLATARFSQRADVEPFWQDVKARIIRNVSVGYVVHRYEETPAKDDNKLPVRLAIDWEPYEISMVPMPADAGAQTRGEKPGAMHDCQIVTRSEEIAPMADEQVQVQDQDQNRQSEFLVERNQLTDPPAQRMTAAAAAEPNDRDRGMAAEQERITGILTAVRAARLPQSIADKLIKDNVPLVRAQGMVFEEMGRQAAGAEQETRSQVPARVQMGEDPFVHERAGIENALLHRVAPTHFKLDDKGRKYRGLTLLDVAKVILHSRGMRTTDMSKQDIAAAALGLNQRVGYHTTSDYPLLLADVANKTLRQEYALAPQTFTLIARRTTLPDYKPSNRLQIGEAPALLPITEHGEYTHGTIGEGREQMQLVKYGRKFAITREAIINDDTDSFSRVPAKFGRAARNLESNLVWFQILSNPTMGDGDPLFHANHGNLDASGDVISIASIGAGRAAMRKQTALDSDGTTFIDAVPRYLLVPPALETLADQFVSVNMIANAAGSVNPFGGRLTVVSEPRLEIGVGTASGSAIAWYLAASVEQGIDLVEYAYLDGEEGPVVESRMGFDIDGLELKCRLDFAAKVIDYRGFFKNDGAAS